MKRNYIIGLMALVVLIVGVYFFNKNSSENVVKNNSTIKIGAVLSLTGFASQDGEKMKEGIELAREDLAKRGINVEINYQDDATDPKKTVSAIQFLSSQGYDTVIGPTWSYLIDAGVPAIEQAKMVAYAPISTSEYIQKTSPNLFLGYTKNALAKDIVKEELKKRSLSKVVLITLQGGWGDSLKKVFEDAASETGGTVVLNERIQYGSEAETTKTIATKAKSLNADSILWTGTKEGAVALIKYLHEQKMDITVIGTTGISDAVNEKLVPVLGLKLIAIQPKVSNAYIEKFKARYNKNPEYFSDSAYDSLMILVEAKQNANGYEGIKNYIEAINYNGYAGTYSFDQKHDTRGGVWVSTEMK